MRAHTALDIIGNTLAQANASVAQQLVGVPMYYNTMVDVNETDFTDWGDFFGPVEEHGDFFTNTVSCPSLYEKSTQALIHHRNVLISVMLISPYVQREYKFLATEMRLYLLHISHQRTSFSSPMDSAVQPVLFSVSR